MGHTLTEKVFARAAGLAVVNAGDEVSVRPDFVLAYEYPMTTSMFFRQMRELGVLKVADPERYGIFVDHGTPSTAATGPLHEETRLWCIANNVQLHDRKGVSHQVAGEIGYAVPGGLVMHHDGHISQLGAFGTLAFGVRRNLIEAFVRDRMPMRVPHTVRIEIEGEPAPGVMARDIFHHLVRALGPSACSFHVVEFGGPTIERMSLDGLQTMCTLAMFLGAESAVVNPSRGTLDKALPRARKLISVARSDADAKYVARHRINIDGLEPIVVAPPHPHDTRSLRDFVGLPINAGYIGSCAGGRLEDIESAARILRGKRVATGVSLTVVPASQAVMNAAVDKGLISDLAAAGVQVPGLPWDYDYGYSAGLQAGQRMVATGTLNTRGRMGSVDAEIYIANAATVAASAMEGRLAFPVAFQ